MRLFSTSSAALIAACLSTSALAQGTQYECSVIDMLIFGENAEFIAQNMRKRFFILLDDDTAYVTQVSDEGQSSQSIYTIVHRVVFDTQVHAVELSPVGMNTIALNTDSGDTTLIVQYPQFANVWKLDCDAR
jgi:hypothetical protein